MKHTLEAASDIKSESWINSLWKGAFGFGEPSPYIAGGVGINSNAPRTAMAGLPRMNEYNLWDPRI